MYYLQNNNSKYLNLFHIILLVKKHLTTIGFIYIFFPNLHPKAYKHSVNLRLNCSYVKIGS